MKKFLILGIVAIFLTVSITSGYGEDKQIDSNTFSFGDNEAFVNITTGDVVIEDTFYNNSANLFIYNNATYDLVTFDVKGGPNADGTYPSDVVVDVGANGRPEYRFGGYGVGQWGNQTSFMDSERNSLSQASIFPEVEGNMFYLKLPSDAVVSSASMNITHIDTAVDTTVTIPSDASWGNGYGYYYRSSWYGYGYGRYYKSNYYLQQNRYPRADARYRSGYPMDDGLLQWDIEDKSLSPPAGATIEKYDLILPIRLDPQFGYVSGQPSSNRYHYGQRTYSIYALEESLPTSNVYGSYIYSWNNPPNPSGFYANYESSVIPDYDDTEIDSYTFSDYHSSSSTDQQFYPSFDLSDLLVDWQDETVDPNGIMVTMSSTPYDTRPHDTYGTSSSSMNYYNYYRSGYMYGPGASSYYNAFKPQLHIEYTLDSNNPWVDICGDNSKEWSYTGAYNGSTTVSNWQSEVNTYLRTHFPEEIDGYNNGWTYVPIKIGADSKGEIILNNVQVLYDYTASISYNPSSGSLTDEVQSLVPTYEEGYALANIVVSSGTEGVIEFSNLRMVGEKPNYPPKVMEIPTIETSEGVIDNMLLAVSDYFTDTDQDPETLQYWVSMNDQEEFVDLFITKMDTRDGKVYLGIDTSDGENWNGQVNVQITAMDDGGKKVRSNIFTVDLVSVNDIPYLNLLLPDMEMDEGIDALVMEYNAPSGRGVARGKETFMIDRSGAPYFMDIEDDQIYMDFELLLPDMEPVPIQWENDEGHRIFMTEDNDAYLTVLPPEYTEDPDNFILLFGTDPDFTTLEDMPLYIRVYVSDDVNDLRGQMYTTMKIIVDEVNDAPIILPIPDIVMDEDSSFISPTSFIEEYVTDIDDAYEDLEVTFNPSSSEVRLSVDNEGKLNIKLDLDFNGVVPVTMEVSDGVNVAVQVFNVMIRSINDPPIVIIDNLYQDQIIIELFRIKGSADDFEKDLRNVEVAITERGDILYADNWIEADGAYVWQYMVDIRNYGEGWHTIYIRGFDGRDFSEVKAFDIFFDPPKPPLPPPPPVVTIDTQLNGLQSENVLVIGTVSDQSGHVSFVEYRIDGSIWRKANMETGSDWKITMDTNTLKNEEHNLSVRAYNGKTYSKIEFQKFEVSNLDSDGDGIPNILETSLLMDPFNKLDGTMDYDGDGFSNYEELVVENTDPFDGNKHPQRPEDKEDLVDNWALLFMISAIVCAFVIVGLFILNIKLERNIHKWREDLSSMRVERKSKTLLQKIVEIAPSFIGASMGGPALPGNVGVDQNAALPPAQEHEDTPPPQ